MGYICKSIENTVKICALSVWGAYTIVSTALLVAALCKDDKTNAESN